MLRVVCCLLHWSSTEFAGSLFLFQRSVHEESAEYVDPFPPSKLSSATMGALLLSAKAGEHSSTSRWQRAARAARLPSARLAPFDTELPAAGLVAEVARW